MKNIKKILLLSSIAIILIITLINGSLAEFIGRYGAGFSIVFWSILLEAMPFVLLGCLISSLIGQFISADFLARLIPKNRIAGIFFAALLGITFPLCECIIIPITRRLIKKGLPMPLATAFMLSVPILNPVVLLSTHYAFKGQAYVVFLRGFLGYFASVIIAILMGITLGFDYNPIKTKEAKQMPNVKSISTKNLIGAKIAKRESKKPLNIVQKILTHTFWEFTDVLKFLIIGAFLSAIDETSNCGSI